MTRISLLFCAKMDEDLNNQSKLCGVYNFLYICNNWPVQQYNLILSCHIITLNIIEM